MNELKLSDLHKGIPALTEAWSGVLEEASIFCLNKESHNSGVIITVDGIFNRQYSVVWSRIVDETMKRCYGDKEDAVQWAACGIAILLILNSTNFNVIERSKKGTGFDYWLGNKEDIEVNIFLGKARLEVSGIQRGSDSEISRRIKIKLAQTDKSDEMNLPVYAIVVEFSRPHSRVAQK